MLTNIFFRRALRCRTTTLWKRCCTTAVPGEFSTHGKIHLPSKASPLEGAEKYQDALGLQLLEEMEKQSDELETDGIVVERKRYICRVSGLRDATTGSLVTFDVPNRPTQVYGIVLSLQKRVATIAVLNSNADLYAIKKGCDVRLEVSRNSTIAPVGALLNPLGQTLDDNNNTIDPLSTLTYWPSKTKASMIAQAPINRPFNTGIRVIDCMQPFGHGHRMAVLGARGSGKTVLALDIIHQITQSKEPIHVVYVIIGKSKSRVAQIYQVLKDSGALEHTTVVASCQDEDSHPMQYITPFSATAIAQSYQAMGRDTLIVFDNMTMHAAVAEEIRKETVVLPSHTLFTECASQLKDGAALTMLALGDIEPKATNVYSGFTSSLLSCTDDWLVLDAELAAKRKYPAIRSISSTTDSASWIEMSNNCNTGVKPIRGYPFQSHFVTESMRKIQARLLQSYQTHLQVELAKRFGFDPEQEAIDILQWRRIVNAFWWQKPFSNPADPTLVALGCFILAECSETMLTAFPSSELEIQSSEIWDLVEKVAETIKQDEPGVLENSPDRNRLGVAVEKALIKSI